MKPLTFRLFGLALALCAVLALPRAASAQSLAKFNTNLIVNGDAEAGQGATNDGNTLVDIPNWTRQGNFQVVQYGASGGFMDASSPGPKDRGKNYFTGGPDSETSSASQTIDVSALASEIAQSGVTFTLAGYLGGYADQHDHAELSARFYDKDGKDLKDVEVGPVTAEQRKNVTGLLPVSIDGAVPAGTQSVVVYVKTVRTDGSYNDGSADNLSLIFKK
jgi:hypothetical protein